MSLSPYEKCIAAHLAATVKRPRESHLSFNAIHYYGHFYSGLYIIFMLVFISRSYIHYLKICILNLIAYLLHAVNFI